jgi:hypothetical protein
MYLEDRTVRLQLWYFLHLNFNFVVPLNKQIFYFKGTLLVKKDLGNFFDSYREPLQNQRG